MPVLVGKFKFNVGVDFIKIEFLNKNLDFASVCSPSIFLTAPPVKKILPTSKSQVQSIAKRINLQRI